MESNKNMNIINPNPAVLITRHWAAAKKLHNSARRASASGGARQGWPAGVEREAGPFVHSLFAVTNASRLWPAALRFFSAMTLLQRGAWQKAPQASSS